ncbi:MAG: hypothetical protein CL923_00145 [Deltaproteobacteria bacterium]|jgi:cyclophilin family peptidyl-prolyl cis-trans isomerase|nr:hypothetical protein [Deltaproteobacteria bacterium]
MPISFRKFLCLLLITTIAGPFLGVAVGKLPDGLYARMTTSRGKILLRLHHQHAPNTVANFVGLAEGTKQWRDPITKKTQKSRFYDGLSFHRVIPNFMIQGGDPLATGSGGPGYQFEDEIHPDLKHDRSGILSMANAGPNTNGSQFFITHAPTPWLDGKHTIFGEVTSGMEVVNAVQQGDTIVSLKIERVGEEAKQFDPVKISHQAKAAQRKLAEKNKKTLPKTNAKPDPKRTPRAGQPEAEEVSLELLVVAYQGSRVPKANLYYDQAGAKKIAEQVVDLVRRKGVDFMELVSQLTDLPEQTRVPMLKRKGAPPFFQSALRLKEGQISDPVDSPFGYLIFHRVKLEKVTASHILLSFKGALRSTQNRSRGEALEMAKLLVAGLEAGKDFAALAKVHSNGPSASKGGLLGSFTRGQMVPEFDKAVFALKPSEVSGVVETPFGFHIIKRHE